jgi:hypothetical protein
MNRYDIKDSSGLIVQSYLANNPVPFSGTQETSVWTPTIDDNGDRVLDDQGNPVGTIITQPPTYTVTVTDVTYETNLALCYKQRQAEYPTIGDQLDAIYKRDHLDDATQWTAVVNQIAATKAKYPKPQQ